MGKKKMVLLNTLLIFTQTNITHTAEILWFLFCCKEIDVIL